MKKQYLLVFFYIATLTCGCNDFSRSKNTLADNLAYGIKPPEHLYVVDREKLTDSEFIAVQTLQGIIAQNKPQIYIKDTTGNKLWLDDLKHKYNISATNVKDVCGDKSIFKWCLNKFKDQISGYVLCDQKNDPDSFNAAMSIAGPLKAVVIDVSQQEVVESIGFKLILDVRGKNDRWAYESYWDQMNHSAINQHPAEWLGFRDWGPAVKAFTIWNKDSKWAAQVYESMNDNSPVFGWDSAIDPGHELNFINAESVESLYASATCITTNMSTLAGMANYDPPITFKQKIHDKKYTTEKNVHYVAFQITDMCNIDCLLNADGWAKGKDIYGSKHRGKFPMGWGMAPSMLSYAPTVVKWWYDNATEMDSFIVPSSGMGYMYPNSFPRLDKHVKQLGTYMEKADLNVALILDWHWPNEMTYESYKEIGELYASIECLRGMLYTDANGDYARYKGKIVWFNGKPLVACRYTLWNSEVYDGISKNGIQLAKSINALPKDPSSEDGYSFVSVHCWSYGMDEIAKTIENLDADVRVVTPVELIEQVLLNKAGLSENVTLP